LGKLMKICCPIWEQKRKWKKAKWIAISNSRV
jgi:hypothetical protein